MTTPQVDYVALKAGMKAKGFPVSEGEHWTAQDQHHYSHFAYLHGFLSKIQSLYALAYTHLLPEGFPGKPSSDTVTTPVAAAAPIEAEAEVEAVSLNVPESTNVDLQTTATVAAEAQQGSNPAPVAAESAPAAATEAPPAETKQEDVANSESKETEAAPAETAKEPEAAPAETTTSTDTPPAATSTDTPPAATGDAPPAATDTAATDTKQEG